MMETGRLDFGIEPGDSARRTIELAHEAQFLFKGHHSKRELVIIVEAL